jgi:hypothetical protein
MTKADALLIGSRRPGELHYDAANIADARRDRFFSCTRVVVVSTRQNLAAVREEGMGLTVCEQIGRIVRYP